MTRLLEKATPFTIIIVLISALGGFLFGYNTGVISGALIFLAAEFNLTIAQEGMVVSMVLIGAIIGVSFAGMLADALGRKLTTIFVALVFIVSSLITCMADSLSLLVIGRFITGIAVGITSIATPLYLSEISPAQKRGAFVAVFQLAITIGILVAYAVNYIYSGSGDWRWMFGIGVVPAALLLIGMLFLPETPGWLLTKGLHLKASKVFELIRKDRNWELHISEMKAVASSKKDVGWKGVFSRKLRKVLIVGIGLSIFQQITGINTVMYYAPKIFQMVGYNTPTMAILPTLGIGIINVLATLAAVYLLDRLGRRTLLLIGTSGMAISLLILSLAFFTEADAIDVIVILSILSYVAFFAISLGAVTWVVISEIYPLHIRGRAMSLAVFANWGFNYIVTLTFLDLVKGIGSGLTFCLYALFSGVAFWFAFKRLPETKNKTLEEIELTFSK